MKGLRPLLNQFQIMLRVELPFIVAKEPQVRGQSFAVMEGLQVLHGQLDLDLEPGIESGYGIPVFIYNHRGIGINLAGRDLDNGEWCCRQR